MTWLPVKSRSILALACVLTAATAISSIPSTAESQTSQNGQMKSSTPATSTPATSAERSTTNTENPAFEYSARKMLGLVSEARVAVNNEHKELALSYVEESMRELDSIRKMEHYMEMMGVRFGRVLYGTDRSYYIPIADETYAVRTYTQGPFWSANKAMAVRDVELVSVDIAINPEKATEHLEEARKQINDGDYDDADGELKELLEESIREKASTDQPLTRLEDNIYLTRILVRQENYDGARYTLKHAQNALDDYEKTVSASSERRSHIDALRKEINALDGTIERRDPTMLKKAADKVDQWWKDLKAWTREQTSE